MRRLLCLGFLTISLGGCTGLAGSATTSDLLVPPSSPDDDPISAPPALMGVEYAGFLPDGTPFVVSMDDEGPETLTRILGEVMYEADGAVWWVGKTTIDLEQGGGDPLSENRVLRIRAGEAGEIRIDLSQMFLDHLGSEGGEAISSGIKGVGYGEWPGLVLQRPFRWATDRDPLGSVGVRYESFEIRHGCSAEAVVCSDSGILQVLTWDGRFSGRNVKIESPGG